MRNDEYLKHLDRAFVEMPPELSDRIELTFRRGEKAVKQRHKIMTAVSVAAVLAVLCAAVALAAGTLFRPRVDSVVATQGDGNGRGEAGAAMPDRKTSISTPTPTPIPTHMPTPTPTPTQTPTLTPTPMPEATEALSIVYTQPKSNYYHSDPTCSGMEDAIEWTEASAISVGKQPCPICLGAEAEAAPEPTTTPVPEEAYEELPVYYTPQGNYYHGYSQCSGMRNAKAHTLEEALSDGKGRCLVCQPGQPDDIGLFVETFGCDLEEMYPDARYAYTLRDTYTGACEWMLCTLDDGGKTYGNTVNLENWTVREEASLPGHAGESLPRLSVWTRVDNALTVWRRAPEPLHGMLQEAEALLRDMPQMMAGTESTPLEYLTRTVVTFDEGSTNVLAVNLWFEGPEAMTTFRWVLNEDGEYEMTLPMIEGEG